MHSFQSRSQRRLHWTCKFLARWFVQLRLSFLPAPLLGMHVQEHGQGASMKNCYQVPATNSLCECRNLQVSRMRNPARVMLCDI